MPASATFDDFEKEVRLLVTKFDNEHAAVTGPGYQEAQLRQDYLDPLFRALGWDLGNTLGFLQREREVEIESRTDIAGRKKRADYLFRTNRTDRFVCEAKKPREGLGPRYAFQAKRYAWNKGVALSVLASFEEFKLYIVGGTPGIDDGDIGLYKTYHFSQLPAAARELHDLLARDAVANGSIDRLLDSLPKRPPRGRGRTGQLYLVKPDRNRSLDAEFLRFLDDARRDLASDLLKNNNREDILEDSRLNEATQHVLDRILFLRICEDRDIDTGARLETIIDKWHRNYGSDDTQEQIQHDLRDSGALRSHPDRAERGGRATIPPKESLWAAIVDQFKALDRRPPSHVPFFNGNLFKSHFSEQLVIGDDWLCDFIAELSDDESPYLFSVIPVEILGSIYERFLGKVVRPEGRGIVVEEKPEVRKAGGVYYTPRYIVDYIVEQTVGRHLDRIAAVKTMAAFDKQTRAISILDPACGSGSFLIRAFERLIEHWQLRFTRHPDDRRKDLCWVDPVTDDVHLTVGLKRRILRDNIYGVDLDPQAVEVTQLSLYLKMLEGEDRATLKRQRELFKEEVALLPPLQDNIKCGNSLVASDFSLVPDDLLRVSAFDWGTAFKNIMSKGGFDAVIGNPPWLYSAGLKHDTVDYLTEHYRLSEYQTDYYTYFIERALSLTTPHGLFSFVVSDSWLKAENFSKLRTHLLSEHRIIRLAMFTFAPFEGATIESSIVALEKMGSPATIPLDLFTAPSTFGKINDIDPAAAAERGIIDPRQSPDTAGLVAKIEAGGRPLDAYVEINRGIHAYRTDGYGRSKFGSGPQTLRDKQEQSYHARTALDATYLAELKGKDVFRFEHVRTGMYVSYGPWLAEPREPKFFQGSKIAIRKVLGRKLHGTFLPDPTALDQSLYVLISRTDNVAQLKCLLGILLSSIGAWYLRSKYAIYDTLYPWYTRKQLGAFPIKGTSDQLVALVDKMLALAPKLRTETRDRQRATLESAVATTELKIDALVYALYGLTAEEVAIVERGSN